MTQPENQARDLEPPSLRKTIFSIAGTLQQPGYARGDLAALRRLDPESPNAPAFWRLLVAKVPEALRGRDDLELERRWALIVKSMALMVPHHMQPRAELGGVLADKGFAEQRLARFLNARGTQFHEQFLRTCRFLAAKAAPVDWVPLARLVLNEGRNESWAEPVRRQIARGYYSPRSARAGAAGPTKGIGELENA